MPQYQGAATAAAPALDPLPFDQPIAPPVSAPAQASLFRDAAGPRKVIPIPTLTPIRPFEREESSQVRRKPRQRRAPERPRSDLQQALNFYPAAASAPISTAVKPNIYCDAPVALPTHRLIAAAIDASMILLAVGILLGIFYVSGGQIELSRQNAPFFLAVVILVAFFYRTLWCLGNGDTPGMRSAGLRLVDFDGRRPDRDQRGIRQLAGMLSFVSAGLGLVWALVDEESLTWHDHISKTFPTIG